MSISRSRSCSAMSRLLLVALCACSSSTEPSGVDATIREVSFATDAERSSWPTTPTISGGTDILIRGTGSFDCGDARVQATRRGMRLEVAVTAANTDRFCLGIIMGWRAYEARVTGLEAGSYTVRVRSVGLRGDATWIIHVGVGAALD